MARAPTGQVLEREGKRGKTFAPRFRASGTRQYLTLGTADAGWTRQRAEEELAKVLADVRRGIWRPVEPAPPVGLPATEPTFHEFASEWLEGRRPELRPRTIEALEWALSGHLLPFFKSHRPSQITVAEVDRYRTAKVRESADLRSRRERGEQCPRPLSARTINTTIAVLAQVLDSAIEHGWVTTANPARGKRRRLKAEKPRRTWLEIDELRALLDAAGEHRALLAVMALGGLRVSEATALRWSNVDLSKWSTPRHGLQDRCRSSYRRPVARPEGRTGGSESEGTEYRLIRPRLLYAGGKTAEPAERQSERPRRGH
jgi:hypothetical protein